MQIEILSFLERKACAKLNKTDLTRHKSALTNNVYNACTMTRKRKKELR